MPRGSLDRTTCATHFNHESELQKAVTYNHKLALTSSVQAVCWLRFGFKLFMAAPTPARVFEGFRACSRSDAEMKMLRMLCTDGRSMRSHIETIFGKGLDQMLRGYVPRCKCGHSRHNANVVIVHWLAAISYFPTNTVFPWLYDLQRSDRVCWYCDSSFSFIGPNNKHDSVCACISVPGTIAMWCGV